MIAVVCHDAGGAEILSSYCRASNFSFGFVLDGPAMRIFARKLGPLKVLSIGEAVSRSESILCATSWQSNLELEAIAMARSEGKRSIAFLDHWINYRERFVRNGEIVLPDEIWVGDPIAVARARKAIPEVPVLLVDNPYFADLRRELASDSKPANGDTQSLSVLFVGEPVKEHARQQTGNERARGYTEDEALAYLIDNIDDVGKVGRLRLRPHPSEASDKYARVIARSPLPVEVTRGTSLVDDIQGSDVIAGCQSMAMVVGLLAGKRVVSCIPPGGIPCELPQLEIETLQQLAKPKIL